MASDPNHYIGSNIKEKCSKEKNVCVVANTIEDEFVA